MALDYYIIGERLKKARTDKNLTQEKLAEKLDVSIAFLSRIERGSSHISLKRLSQICDIFNLCKIQKLHRLVHCIAAVYAFVFINIQLLILQMLMRRIQGSN